MRNVAVLHAHSKQSAIEQWHFTGSISVRFKYVLYFDKKQKKDIC